MTDRLIKRVQHIEGLVFAARTFLAAQSVVLGESDQDLRVETSSACIRAGIDLVGIMVELLVELQVGISEAAGDTDPQRRMKIDEMFMELWPRVRDLATRYDTAAQDRSRAQTDSLALSRSLVERLRGGRLS